MKVRKNITKNSIEENQDKLKRKIKNVENFKVFNNFILEVHK
ncbi:MAG: hypothetical protein QXL82_02165 [Candidatus Aenigmatarchaeota archaeon]